MANGLTTWFGMRRRSDVPEDGFGQSMWDDVRYFARFRALKRQPLTWSEPEAEDSALVDSHPIISRFGDALVATAMADGRKLYVLSRMWNGWPDPPEFVFFALNDDRSIWAARDFDFWPVVWQRPGTAKESSGSRIGLERRVS